MCMNGRPLQLTHGRANRLAALNGMGNRRERKILPNGIIIQRRRVFEGHVEPETAREQDTAKLKGALSCGNVMKYLREDFE